MDRHTGFRISVSTLAVTLSLLVTTIANGQPTGMDLANSLRKQVERCWLPLTRSDGRVPDVVSVSIKLNIDGTLAGQPQLESKLDVHDPYARVEVWNAIHAITVCAPYKMPPDQYETWKEVDIRFDASGLSDPSPTQPRNSR